MPHDPPHQQSGATDPYLGVPNGDSIFLSIIRPYVTDSRLLWALHGDSILPRTSRGTPDERCAVDFSEHEMELFFAPLLAGVFREYLSDLSYSRVYAALFYSGMYEEWPISMYTSGLYIVCFLFRQGSISESQIGMFLYASAILSRAASAGGWRGMVAFSAFWGWCQDRFPELRPGPSNSLRLGRIEYFLDSMSSVCNDFIDGVNACVKNDLGEHIGMERDEVLECVLPNGGFFFKGNEHIASVSEKVNRCVGELGALSTLLADFQNDAQ